MFSYIIINSLIQILNFITNSIDHFDVYVFNPSLIIIIFITVLLRVIYYIILNYYNIDNYDMFLTFETILSITFAYFFGFKCFDIDTSNLERLMNENNSLVTDINIIKQDNYILNRNYNNLKEYNLKLRYKLPEDSDNNVLNNLNDISVKLSSIINKLNSDYDCDILYEKIESYNNKVLEEILPKFLDKNNLNNIRRHFRRILREMKNL